MSSHQVIAVPLSDHTLVPHVTVDPLNTLEGVVDEPDLQPHARIAPANRIF